ncbi:uncharacterized protein LOC111253982 isoform X2 [Varroa destructor]|uniref:Uncharacterized protein n=1 Tax=Varroa destructor TaxID=109461 RepID=A0A7M7KWR8_VARDE|nr:uncharacterized protein LOC111253982 isoform X2 [Varroa destructor]XP_022670088.1 uncharacterized protein LOC111253982 isoform X2 [Varroa destructor]
MLRGFNTIFWLTHCFMWSQKLLLNPLAIVELSSPSVYGKSRYSRISLTVLPGISRKKFRFHEILKTARERSTNAEQDERFVEMRWFNIEPNSTIALYGHPPEYNITNMLERVSSTDQSSGYYITNITMPRLQCDTPFVLNNNCIYFWIAVLDTKMRIMEVDCFRGFPFWMYEAREFLSNVEIRRAFIPGTHNSGTYDYYDGGTVHARVTQYVECQDESVFNQLFYGARYIELRASFSPKRRQARPANIVCIDQENDNANGSNNVLNDMYREERGLDCRTATFWSVHGSFVTTSSFDQIARDIRRFLEATKEIVLIDLHKFKISGKWWWTTDLHLELWRLLSSELGEFMAPFKEDVTFGELWESNKRLIVSTAHPVPDVSPCIWPSFLHIWANTDRLSQLELFLDARLCAEVQNSKRITVAKGQLTPRLGLKMLRNTLRNRGGVRSFTPGTNRVMDRLYRNKLACANVVAVDYLLSSDVVRMLFTQYLRNRIVSKPDRIVSKPEVLKLKSSERKRKNGL